MENVLHLSAELAAHVHPRRGGTRPPERPAPDPGAPAFLAELVRQSTRITEVLESSETGPAVAAAARAFLDGAADPRGAGAVGQIVVGTGASVPTRARRMVDAWRERFGLAFAVRAYAEALTLGSPSFTYGRWEASALVDSDDRDAFALLTFGRPETARHVRALVATASDGDHAEVESALAGHRDGAVRQVVAAYLVPARADWVDDAVAAVPSARVAGHRSGPALAQRWMLAASVGTPEQLAALHVGVPDLTPIVLANLADTLGEEIVTALAAHVDIDETDPRRVLLDALACLPGDAAFRLLVDRAPADRAARAALLAGSRRFPVRALRLLGEELARGGPAAGPARTIVSGLVRSSSGLDTGALPEPVRAAVAAAVPPSRPADSAAVLPRVLAEPPWTRPRPAGRPPVLELTAPEGVSMHWADGEREQWRAESVLVLAPPVTTWDAVLTEVLDSERMSPWSLERFLVHAPDHLADTALMGRIRWVWDLHAVRPAAARHGADALVLVLIAVHRDAVACAGAVLPFRSAATARLVVRWLSTGRTLRAVARRWLDRHGTAAVPLVLPDAFGTEAKVRQAAETALRHIADRHGRDAVLAAAGPHGDAAVGALGALLDRDPLTDLPKRLPEPGAWADPAWLPPLLLRDGAGAVPTESVGDVLTVMALTKVDDPYAGLTELAAACDPGSLAAFGRAVFETWSLADTPSADGWALDQLGCTGDDDTVRMLVPVIRAWPGEGGHSRAVVGLDVLARIGTTTALVELNGIALKVRFKGLRARAGEKVTEVAESLGLTGDELADRLVPDLDLSADGTRAFDYGPRSFTVRLDEQLRPCVLDEAGKRLRDLPKPGAKDDPELAPAAKKAFTAFKKELRAAAAIQLLRLERAMVDGRRWDVATFRAHIAGHPLLRGVARRLVWGVEGGPEFRIAEDGSAATVDDEPYALADGARVGISHPVEVSDVAAWSEVFADYEILQPFPQLARPVHALTDAERDSGTLTRFEGVTVPVGAVLGLVGRGWERGRPLDAGVEQWISRRLARDRFVVVELDPGIAVGTVAELGDQTLRHVWLSVRPTEFHPVAEMPHRFGELHPRTASEILVNLADVAAAAR